MDDEEDRCWRNIIRFLLYNRTQILHLQDIKKRVSENCEHHTYISGPNLTVGTTTNQACHQHRQRRRHRRRRRRLRRRFCHRFNRHSRRLHQL